MWTLVKLVATSIVVAGSAYYGAKTAIEGGTIADVYTTPAKMARDTWNAVADAVAANLKKPAADAGTDPDPKPV